MAKKKKKKNEARKEASPPPIKGGKTKILVEGAISFPIQELRRIAAKCGVYIRLCWNFDKAKKQGEISTKDFDALFLGPRPHNVKKGGCGNMKGLHGEQLEKAKIFVCHTLNSNRQIKITKSSFKRALKEFLNSEQ